LGEEPQFDRRKHEVWPFEGELGFRRSIETAGAVAAPLLAGFSFTLLFLLLPTLDGSQTMMRAGANTSIITESQGFTAFPEVAAILLLIAGLLLIASVQATLAMRFHGHRPADLAEWYPEYFREAPSGGEPPKVPNLEGWTWEGGEPIGVQRQWYGAWPRKFLFDELNTANRWARRMRRLYHAGVIALLCGLAFAAVPPEGQADLGRWMLFAVAAAGVVFDGAWIILFQWEGQLKTLLSRMSHKQEDS
jgi:hypothetical protein